MASLSSLIKSRTYRFNTFSSFHGPDVRKSFLSHLRKQFSYNGITMFDDQGIERSETIAPSLVQAIRESRILIVILSKNYASSSWCLNELVEIMECKKVMGQIVMTIFYGVDPTHVRKQIGDFGKAFTETCSRSTDVEKLKWEKALTDVSNILGEHLLNWDNEANMIEKVAGDVSRKLNATPSKDFQDMEGLEAHLKKMQFLLHLDHEDEAMIVGICGPAGIGKTTIARALHSLLSSSFRLSCFMENLKESYNSGLDEYGLKLFLQQQLLSKILNQNGMRVYHLGAIHERLSDQKVLIILDDVNDLKQLEALANETTWFGPGSRIIVTTEDQELLQQHGINNTYQVGFPSKETSLKILCKYAFRQSFPRRGFKELAVRLTKLCGNLPLGLSVVGSSLRGKKEDEWEEVMRRLEIFLDHRDIEDILRVGYESLHDNEKSLFLHIAVFFNHKDVDSVNAMLAENNLDIKHGLRILVNRSLIYISTKREVVMHKLLQQVGRQVIHRQEPWKRQILIDAHEICDVLENDTGNRALSGISFDTSGINEVIISDRALRRMSNLRFLSVYKTRYDGNERVHIPGEIEFPPRLRLLHWEAYPKKSLPLRFCLANLVELYMRDSQLEKLWEGTQPLTNLKKMDFSSSRYLKELPDLSNAINLKRLQLNGCTSLVELPSSIANLHKLEDLVMNSCVNLEVVPTNINLASLERIYMIGCSRLRVFPNISTNISQLLMSETGVENVPPSIKLCNWL
ncbi:disease resistance protein RML1A-like [Capsella rubella]|uniref:disease resistance protein RML1A-like n=1 Tax=Capsella rubella TaxID=81985 RepID=UPI000CD4F2D0|nr:disease resistance protein RML1A-like [Capsella rubella]